jgi:hypothetical protein
MRRYRCSREGDRGATMLSLRQAGQEGQKQVSAWARCYDHNFLRFFKFLVKRLAFFSNTNIMINFFFKFSFVLSQKRHFLQNF